jgi:electron-transferring-flavoprotein dehydrogenase
MDLGDFPNRRAYALLRDEDERIPAGKQYIERLLEREFPEYDLKDFPLVEDRGKQKGTEAYPISSTRPVDSPVGADVAVVGGAMGATSAFHEGGDHVAVRTGKIAGRLAAQDRLGAYNDEWHQAIGDEVLRNVTMADMVRDFEPPDWDRIFKTVRTMTDRGSYGLGDAVRGGLDALQLFARYRWTQFRFRKARYAQFRENEYVC